MSVIHDLGRDLWVIAVGCVNVSCSERDVGVPSTDLVVAMLFPYLCVYYIDICSCSII